MKRTNVDTIVAKFFRAKMTEEIQRLSTLAYDDLYSGPLQGCDVCGADHCCDCSCAVKWPGFSDAIDKVGAWASEMLPSEIWVDIDCEYISEYEPQGEEIDGEWQEPDLDSTYHVTLKEIKRAIFGEVAEYI